MAAVWMTASGLYLRMELADGVVVRKIERVQFVVYCPLRRRTILRGDDLDAALTRQPYDVAAYQTGAARYVESHSSCPSRVMT